MMLTEERETRKDLYTTQAPLNGLPLMVRRIQREYAEMPGLALTEAQARRLWGLDGQTCRLALTTLLAQRFLRRTTAGMYVRAS